MSFWFSPCLFVVELNARIQDSFVVVFVIIDACIRSNPNGFLLIIWNILKRTLINISSKSRTQCLVDLVEFHLSTTIQIANSQTTFHSQCFIFFTYFRLLFGISSFAARFGWSFFRLTAALDHSHPSEVSTELLTI